MIQVLCMSFCTQISGTACPHRQIFVHFAHGRGSSLSQVVVVRYLLPVLRMTSCFHFTHIGQE